MREQSKTRNLKLLTPEGKRSVEDYLTSPEVPQILSQITSFDIDRSDQGFYGGNSEWARKFELRKSDFALAFEVFVEQYLFINLQRHQYAYSVRVARGAPGNEVKENEEMTRTRARARARGRGREEKEARGRAGRRDGCQKRSRGPTTPSG